MSNASRTIALLFTGVIMLGGCTEDLPLPTESGNKGSAAGPIRSAFDLVARDGERPHEAAFQKISQQIKGFGGYFYDEEGNMVAYLVDPAEERLAREVLEPIIKARDLSDRERSSGQILFRKAAHSFLELSEYRNRASDPVLNVSGVQFTDLDEAQNRFVVGLSREASREEVAKLLEELKVPLEAVTFEESGKVEEDLTLRDYKRPIEGGYQIQRPDGATCTLGFNAYWSGYATFLTNSHCTANVWQNNNTLIYQNNNAGVNLVGFELSDPKPYTCGIFGLYRCRWSDAAVIYKYGSVSANYGKIARTTFWGSPGNVGSITVDPYNPRMTIIGEYSFPTGGEMFDKMGRTTGWTYGFVKKTCVDMNKPSYTGGGIGRILCQDWTNYKSDGGDSGSPVFRWYGSTVRLAGIHWGGITEGGVRYAILSAMWNIEHDLGALATF
jgi:hypothetical protein